jgi:hypothetical protein
MTWTLRPAAAAAAAVLLLASTADAAIAPAVSATAAPTQLTPTTFNYALALTDATASPSVAGTFWLAWVPGEDFLATSPLTVDSPAGWTDTITHAGATDGYAIQWKATSAASDLPIGGTLSGFSFTTDDAPSSVFGDSSFYPGTPTLTSVSYDAAPFSDPGDTFVVSSSVPEPTAVALLAPAAAVLVRRRRAYR